MIWIDFLPRQQIIERPNPVPGSPGAKKLAHQVLLIAGPQMLAHAIAMPRLQILGDVLQSLALPERFLFLLLFDFLSIAERKNPIGLATPSRRNSAANGIR